MRIGEAAVLICGPMRAGKTTMANYLVEKHEFTQVAIADKLKELYYESTNRPGKDRRWLQTMGAAHRKVFGEDFWVDALIKDFEKSKIGRTTFTQGIKRVVIDDVRYENELFLLYNYALQRFRRVYVVLVTVPQDIQVIRGAEIPSLNHESELFSRHLQNFFGSESGGGFLYDDIPSRYSHILDMWIDVLDGTLPLNEYYREIELIVDLERLEIETWKDWFNVDTSEE